MSGNRSYDGQCNLNPTMLIGSIRRWGERKLSEKFLLNKAILIGHGEEGRLSMNSLQVSLKMTEEGYARRVVMSR
jgi:hypothetical protein